MKVIGIKIKKMVKASKNFNKEIITTDNLKMENPTELAFIDGLKVNFIKEIGSMANDMETDYGKAKIKNTTKDNGNTEKWMVQVVIV